ncbi:MAG: NmrA family protein [Rhodobacteraceae bacterium]|uniref:SDR family oxidoreductase n=1 Tax=Cypionkella sp. TaxID=2811411 RepID=UPI00132C6678|nr:SDR family oxidoreductase [Cypionkella sp.]KAF0172530.1 MAG: NmrA family protein [Paracoccaceae bacterium]MDO8325651.1 SDR family oxidoreductase [Cypionkella sp.]
MTIAITGATGQLGRLALAALKARAPQADLIALVRNPAAVTDTPARAFDYTKPETLAPALAGVDTLVLISSNDFNDRAGQHRAVIDAAKAAGVGRIIYTSILKGDASPMLLAQDHIATEAALNASGLSVTLLRNGWYSENYTGALQASVAHGTLIGASGAGRIASAARADYAEAIAVTALDDSHADKTYELAGDVPHSMADFAAEVSRQVGKDIPFNTLPKDTYAQILQSFGLPEGFAAILADSDDHAARGALLDESHSLSYLIGRPTTPIAQTIAAAL